VAQFDSEIWVETNTNDVRSTHTLSGYRAGPQAPWRAGGAPASFGGTPLLPFSRVAGQSSAPPWMSCTHGES